MRVTVAAPANMMNHRTHRATAGRLFAFLLAGGLMLGLSGCTATADVPSLDVASSPPTTPTAVPVETEGDAEGSTEPGDAAQCLHGTWLADNEYFLASMQQFGDAIDSVTGRVTLTFSADGTFATEYADWVLSGTNEGVAVTIARAGVDTGVYSAAGDALTISQTSVDSTMSVTAGGVEMPVAPVAANYSGATFVCADASASITTADGTVQLTRE